MTSKIVVNNIEPDAGISTVSILGIATATNFKTGTTNVHNVGVELAGINVLGADTPIGTGATIYDDGGARFSGIVSATSFVGSGANLTGIDLGAVTGATGDFSIADKIVHTGDTNTAIRFPGADTVSVETAGSQRILIESGGDVSIGGMDANTFSNYRTLTIGGAGASTGAGIDLERSDGTIYGRLFADSNGLQIGAPASGDYIRFELENVAYAKVDTGFGLKADNTCKAWLCYRSEAGNEGIQDDFNVASVNDEGTGTFWVNLDRNIHRHGNGFYQSIVFGSYNASSYPFIASIGYAPSHGSYNPWWDVEDNGCRVQTQRSDTGAILDAKVFSLAMFGDTSDLSPT